MEVDRLNHMFSNLYGEGLSRAWMPPVDIYETAQHEVVIKAELPDMKREDISVTFENNVLTLKGERRFESDVPREQFPAVGALLRQLQPIVHASGDDRRRADQRAYKDGVLTVRLPQREEAKPKQITVSE